MSDTYINIKWPEPTRLPALRASDIHVWAATIDDVRTAMKDIALLSGDERVRAESIVSTQDRRQFVKGRILLRNLLGLYLDVFPSEVAFKYNPHGKPVLNMGESQLHFNMAHSHELALIAVCRERFLGVDVEELRNLDDIMEIAVRFFSRQEISSLQKCLPEEKTAMFFRYWTAKEAYIKACGKSVSESLLKRIDIAFAGFKGDGWQIETGFYLRWLSPASRFLAALAYDVRCKNITCCRWPAFGNCL